MAVEVRPRRLTVEQEHRRPPGWTFVEMVDAESTAHGVVDLDVVGREGVTREPLEPLVWCSHRLHDDPPCDRSPTDGASIGDLLSD